MRIRGFAIGCLVGGGVLLATQVYSQEKPVSNTSSAPAMPSPQQMAERYAKYAVPGDQHKALNWYVGKWTLEYELKMPGGKGRKGTGEAEFKLLFDGRYLQQDTTSTFGPGMGILGYDRFRKKYFSFWIDANRTDCWLAEGEGDDEGKKIDFIISAPEPMGDIPMRKLRGEQRRVDDNTWTYKYVEMPEGSPEFEVLEIRYSRKQ